MPKSTSFFSLFTAVEDKNVVVTEAEKFDSFEKGTKKGLVYQISLYLTITIKKEHI